MSDETTYEEFEGIGADARIGDEVVVREDDLTVSGQVAGVKGDSLYTKSGRLIGWKHNQMTIRRPKPKLPVKFGSVILVRKMLGMSFEDHPMCRTLEGFVFLVDALSGTATTYFDDEIQEWTHAKIVPTEDGE